MTDHQKRAAMVWLTDIAESPVGFRSQYSQEEEKQLAGFTLQIIEEQDERIAIMSEGGDDR